MAKTIQWFPGHMTKAKRQMEENLKKVDFVIEIRDARMPHSSRNPMLDQLIGQKPRLILLSKKDKANPEITRAWIEYFSGQGNEVIALDLTKDRFQKQLVSAAMKLNAPLIEKQKRRGMNPRALRAMVVGIPNVGKSTFINSFVQKKAAKTADRPGVTKALQWIRIGKQLELLDTPGVLWPKFEDEKTGMILAALGSINDQILPLNDIAAYCLAFLMEHYPEKVKEVYGIELQETPEKTLLEIGRKRGWMLKGEVDEQRLLTGFLRDVRDNRFGPISWEQPDVQEPDDQPA